MATCAVIDSNNIVINLIVADPVDPPPSGCILAFKPDTVFVDLGYTWNGISFLDKEGNVCQPAEEQPAEEQPAEEQPADLE